MSNTNNLGYGDVPAPSQMQRPHVIATIHPWTAPEDVLDIYKAIFLVLETETETENKP